MQTLSSTTRVRHKPTAVQGITYSLTAKGKKSFEVRYTDPATGKQRYESVGTFEQAKARLREVQHKHVKGEVVGDPTITVGELIERWREGRAPVKPKTARIYDDYVRLHIQPRWGKTRVRARARMISSKNSPFRLPVLRFTCRLRRSSTASPASLNIPS